MSILPEGQGQAQMQAKIGSMPSQTTMSWKLIDEFAKFGKQKYRQNNVQKTEKFNEFFFNLENYVKTT